MMDPNRNNNAKFQNRNPINLEEKMSKVDVGRIFGKIKLVDNFPDYKVKIVENFADLHVQVVDNFLDKPGKWQFVDNFPNFKIKLVENFPDFTVKYVKNFPGVQK